MNESPCLRLPSRTTRLWRQWSLPFSIVAFLVAITPLSAQNIGDGARELSRRVTDEKLEIGFILDVIRQGIQSGHIERIPDYLDAAYTDHEPDASQDSSRRDVIERLRSVLENTQGRARPPGLERLSGLFDFGWSDIEIETNLETDGSGTATAQALGSTPGMNEKVRVLFHLQKTVEGWRIMNSEKLMVLLAALEKTEG